VHNLFADVDRSAKLLQRNLDNIDGTYNTCAETSRLQKKYLFGFYGVVARIN
jgi:hypothetical protein